MATRLYSLVKEELVEPLLGSTELRNRFLERFDRKRILFNFGENPFFIRVYGDVEIREGKPLHYDLEVSGDEGAFTMVLLGDDDPVGSILSGRIQFRQPLEPEEGLYDATDMLYLLDAIRSSRQTGG